MKGLPHGARREYAWPEAQEELEDGIHPEVVAARLGEPVAYVLEVAEQQGWSVTYQGPTAEQILDAHERRTDEEEWTGSAARRGVENSQECDMKRKSWRCFHCDELFTNPKHAASHFGVEEGTTPGCVAVLRHGEGHLLDRIRDLTEQLSRFYVEDSDIMRWAQSKEADYRSALISEEERGYEKGCRDMRAMLEAEGLSISSPERSDAVT